MKKFLTVLMSLSLVFGLAACSNGTTAGNSTSDSSGPESAAVSTAEEDTASTGQSGSTLVVYFSATGNTEQAANYIAQVTGGDLFELVPTQPYTSDDLNWTDDNSRVVREHDNPDQRNVELEQDTVENWDAYDTVYIGYPIWWGIAAWPVDTFVQANDFTGKTVIPFCTSSSSGLGDSGRLLADLAGTGDWQQGQRFSSRVTLEEVQSWIDSMS